MRQGVKKDKIGSSFKERLWNGSIVAALIAALAVFGVMLQMEKNVLTQYERGSIFVAVREIPEGQMITMENYQEFLEERTLDKSCIPATAISQPEQITKLAAVARIDEGTLLTQGMFETINEITTGMKAPVIAGLKSEDLYQMAGGVLRAGDRVHIYSIGEEEEAKLVWENVYVQGVFDQTGTAVANEDNTTAVQRINVYLDEADVEQFYSELNQGSLRVVKVCD